MNLKEIIDQEISEFARDYDRPRRDYSDRPRRDYGDRTRVGKEFKHDGQTYAKSRQGGDETYALRSKVMKYIIESKRLVQKYLGIEQPRVTMRVVDWTPNEVLSKNAIACATGYGTGVILVPAETINAHENYLKHITYHEILHAIYCVYHDKSSPLMHPSIPPIPLSSAELDRLFIEEVKKSGKYKRKSNKL